MTLDQLRKPAPKNVNVSFLRRTQYIATPSGLGTGRVSTPSMPKPAASAAQKQKLSKDDPIHVKKYIQKGFDIAYPQSKHSGNDTPSRIRGLPATKAEVDAWNTPMHQDNPKLKPVGFYPVLPDLTGFPDPGGFLQFKFDKAPVQSARGKRDERMDVGLLFPSTPEERVLKEHESKIALHKTNSALYPDPGPMPYDYDLFLPEKQSSIKAIKASLNQSNLDRDNPDNYTNEADDVRFFRYDRARTYATSLQSITTEQKYNSIALVLFDPSESQTQTNSNNTGESARTRLSQKGAYYYPILGKIRLKPERARTIAQAGLAPTIANKDNIVHQLQVTVRDPDEAESHKRNIHRSLVDSRFAKTMPELEPQPLSQAQKGGEGNGEADAGGDGKAGGSDKSVEQRSRTASVDRNENEEASGEGDPDGDADADVVDQ